MALSAGGLRAVISLARDDALLEWSPMETLFSAQACPKVRSAQSDRCRSAPRMLSWTLTDPVINSFASQVLKDNK